MKKILLTISILVGLGLGANSLAFDWESLKPTSLWGAIVKIVQDIVPGGEGEEEDIFFELGEDDEEFVDPRQVKDVLRQIKDVRRESKRIVKILQKLPNSQDDVSQLNSILEQIAGIESRLNSGQGLRDTLQEFWDAQYWDELNIFRAKAEIPKEIKNWGRDVKKVEKMLSQKSYQNIGLNLEAARARMTETKEGMAKVQEYYNSGDLESAIGELDEVRQEAHPGEIMSVIQRMKDAANQLKKVKNQELKNQINEALQEIVSEFNEGNFREARELMDDSFNLTMQMIAKALKVGKKKGITKEQFQNEMRKLDERLKEKSEEIEIREQAKEIQLKEKQLVRPAEPVQPVQQIQPVQEVQSAQPAPKSEESTSSQPAPVEPLPARSAPVSEPVPAAPAL